MIQRYLGTTVYGMRCKYVDTKSLPYNTLSRYHIKKRRTYGLTLSPYHIKKTTDQGRESDRGSLISPHLTSQISDAPFEALKLLRNRYTLIDW
jgi:hypothetical protein